MKSKVLNRKMFSAIRHDAHGVGITSGLTRRPSYASGGRVGRLQGGGFGEEEVVTEETTPWDDSFGAYDLQAQRLYPTESQEDLLGDITKMRGDTRQQDWFDLARFFSALPGEGGVGENVARAIGEVLPGVQKRKLGVQDKMIEDQLAYEQYKLGQETKRGEFIEARIAEDRANLAKLNQGKALGSEATARVLARTDKMMNKMALEFDRDPDVITSDELYKYALEQWNAIESTTDTYKSLWLADYGIGPGPNLAKIKNEKLAAFNKLQEERYRTEDLNELKAISQTIDEILGGNEFISAEEQELLGAKFELVLRDKEESSGMDENSLASFGSPLHYQDGNGDMQTLNFSFAEIQAMPAEDFYKNPDALNYVAENMSNLMIGYMKPGMRVVLPNRATLVFTAEGEWVPLPEYEAPSLS